jgi:hypothetical protein
MTQTIRLWPWMCLALLGCGDAATGSGGKTPEADASGVGGSGGTAGCNADCDAGAADAGGRAGEADAGDRDGAAGGLAGADGGGGADAMGGQGGIGGELPTGGKGGAGVPDAGPPPEPDARLCTPGAADCPCDEGNSCDPGLFCAGGICRVPQCDLGDEGCTCFADGTCRTAPNGRAMECVENVCRVPAACLPGSLNCGCAAMDRCDGGLFCQDGTCLELECVLGERGCLCAENERCDDGLVCEPIDAARPHDLRCVGAQCIAGTEACPCDGGACAMGLRCNGLRLCEACPAGVEGCGCDAGACGHGLLCLDDLCVPRPCAVGTEGCVCGQGESCGLNDRGESLFCDLGHCAAASCVPGRTGCACLDGARCTAAGDDCRDGFCQPVDCAPGSENCTCANGRCLGALTCRNGAICVDGTGFPGGACGGGPGGTDCAGSAVCVDGRCAACVAGDAGCVCLDDDTCLGAAVCTDGLCEVPPAPPVVPPAREPPANPRCYTPCQASFEDELGIFRRCAADGLLQGCLDGRTCREGACLLPGEAPPTCRDDLGCPSFQTCIAGGCYSDCETDRNCGPGQTCSLRVCRQICDAADRPCPEGSHCEASDAETGVCLPTEVAVTGEQTAVPGSIDVNQVAFQLTNASPRALFAVTNNTGARQTVTVRKLSHLLYTADNRAESLALDADSDGVGEAADNCPFDANPTQANADGDARGDACDTDDDNDGLPDREDNCPLVANADGPAAQLDTDDDGVGDPCQGDLDADGTPDARDNCPTTANRAQVDTDRDGQGDDCEPVDDLDCDAGGDCPLFWLEMGLVGDAARQAALELDLAAGETATVELAAADEVEAVRWTGELEVEHATLNRTRVALAYSRSPEGQWTGQIRYFANFGDAGLYDSLGADAPDGWAGLPNPPPGSVPAQWLRTRDDAVLSERLGNALLQRWSAFRRGRLTGGWDEFQAVLRATQSESWRSARVRNDCQSAACYPYDSNRLGLKQYSSNLDTVPIPTGVVELPFAMNLHVPDPVAAPTRMSGRIESTTAMHYPGNPSVSLTFDADPAACSRTIGGACMVFLEDLEATVAVGGRYETTADDTDCAAYPDNSYAQVRTPWLVPGFVRNTTLDPASGSRYRYECRDARLPHAEGIDPSGELRANLAAAAANPVPDGRARFRRFELVDGVLVNQTTLFIFFREHFDSFLDPVADTAGFSAYGYIVLTRLTEDIDPADADADGVADLYEGSTVTDDRDGPDDRLALTCPSELIGRIPGTNGRVNAANAGSVAMTLIDGVTPGANLATLTANSREQAHYVCLETGLIDGGPDNVTPALQTLLNNDTCNRINGTCEDGGDGFDADAGGGLQVRCALGTDTTDCGPRYAADADTRVACPVGSEVVYFTVDATELPQADIAALPCQTADPPDCHEVVEAWVANNGPVLQYPARWACTDADRAFCSDDRHDLRRGKTFFAAAEDRAVFDSIREATAQAFRYKVRFRNPDGQQVGFAPPICPPGGGEQVLYCYDPETIESIRGRVDCLIGLQQSFRAHMTVAQQARLDAFLTESFSFTEEVVGGVPLSEDGFERLYAELLVLQGDESVTRSFQSRFDLAGQNSLSFEGSLFEDGGLDLSGQTGFEMYSLYQGLEYYQEALDRFYALSPQIWAALRAGNSSRNFVTPETATRYFDRLIRASTQKTQAYSEIARRYQGFNEPAVARRIIERAYTGAYLESIVMSQMMSRVVEVAEVQERRQVQALLDEAQRRYRIALLGMQDVYASITDAQTFLGVPPDYVPIPALDSGDYRESNAFEALFRRAEAKVQTARERELAAIDSNRSFQTDAAQFQAELVRIRNTYEDQLANLCGTFQVDGHVYPATAKYAPLHDRLADIGDPCGLVSNGQLHEAMLQFEVQATELARIKQTYDNVFNSVEIERQRVSQQCGLIVELSDFVYEQEGRVSSLQQDVREAQFAKQAADRFLHVANGYAGLSKCSPVDGECATSVAAAIGFTVATVVVEATVAAADLIIAKKERKIAGIQRDTARWQSLSQCQTALVDSNARVADMLLRINEIDLELLRQEYEIQIRLAELQQLRNQATRLQQQQGEAESLAINVEAARNDPNVRVYRNDAIINADLTFDDALREAYRMTQTFEYYTSQSYADKDRLYFIRMVSRGQDNLENYLIDINNVFQEFQETYGLADTRVMVVSLQDDILAIPRISEDGRALAENERNARMLEALRNPENLDENGYLRFSFSTDIDETSPLTRNHKVLNLRAEVIGADFGDHVARLYLKQKGTGVIRGLDDGNRYYRLPDRTAVINPYFNNAKEIFADAVYTSGRFRDRPLVNTEWQLVINQRDEAANQDWNLQGLDDIKLYIYYTDFTAF